MSKRNENGFSTSHNISNGNQATALNSKLSSQVSESANLCPTNTKNDSSTYLEVQIALHQGNIVIWCKDQPIPKVGKLGRLETALGNAILYCKSGLGAFFEKRKRVHHDPDINDGPSSESSLDEQSFNGTQREIQQLEMAVDYVLACNNTLHLMILKRAVMICLRKLFKDGLIRNLDLKKGKWLESVNIMVEGKPSKEFTYIDNSLNQRIRNILTRLQALSSHTG